jgi:hypothetical protein
MHILTTTLVAIAAGTLLATSALAQSVTSLVVPVAAGAMTADSPTADCRHACHVVVKAKDDSFHPYQKR